MSYSYRVPLLLILFLILNGLCFFISPTHGQELDNEKSEKMRLLGLLSKAENMELWRERMQSLYVEINDFTSENDGKIAARHLEELKVAIEDYRKSLQPDLAKFSDQSGYDFFGEDFIIQVSSSKDSVVNKKYSRLMNAAGLRASRARRRTYRKVVTKFIINPKDDLGKELFREFLYQLSARLMILDNYSLGLIPYMSEKSLRFAITRDEDSESSEMVEEMWHHYINSIHKSDQLEDFIDYSEDLKEMAEISDTDKVLLSLIENSVTTTYIRKRSGSFNFFKDIFVNMSFMAQRRWGAYKEVGTSALYQASKVFGNTMGLFQSRNGLLYDMSIEDEKALAARLKPLDIVMEKTPFRLTDKFIPGHFGHAAIWVGTEEELKNIGIWDELPRLYKEAKENHHYKGEDFQSAVRNGARIIEALRPGVQYNTLRHFLDIDDFAVMRPKECESWSEGEPFCLDNDLKKEYLIKAFTQVGKDYDFAFDVNTDETIVCSELIYRTYLDVDFETSLTVGSYNISPDQVAYQGDDEGDIFTPVILIHDGEEIENDIQSFFKELLFQ